MTCKPALSLYFHIPFCRRKCDYCHFYVVPDQERYQALLMEGLELEWQRVLSCVERHELVTVYFGGGTPARLSPERVARLVDLCRPYLADGAELTLEANPDDISPERMRRFLDAGVNRLSIGVQSFDDALLPRLGRQHDAAQAAQAVVCCTEAGFENISIDLMYDLPGQQLASWEASLEKACSLPVSHVSLYNLQIERATVFYKHRKRIQAQMPGEALSTKMLQTACERLEAAGLSRYEISAFGRPSEHNTGYWQGRPFLGLGPSAFSYYGGRRFRNIANLHRYHRLVASGQSAKDFDEKLDPAAQQREMLVVGLRLLAGVELRRFDLDDQCQLAVQRLKNEGLLESDGLRLRLTDSGRMLHDHIASELI